MTGSLQETTHLNQSNQQSNAAEKPLAHQKFLDRIIARFAEQARLLDQDKLNPDTKKELGVKKTDTGVIRFHYTPSKQSTLITQADLDLLGPDYAASIKTNGIHLAFLPARYERKLRTKDRTGRLDLVYRAAKKINAKINVEELRLKHEAYIKAHCDIDSLYEKFSEDSEEFEKAIIKQQALLKKYYKQVIIPDLFQAVRSTPSSNSTYDSLFVFQRALFEAENQALSEGKNKDGVTKEGEPTKSRQTTIYIHAQNPGKEFAAVGDEVSYEFTLPKTLGSYDRAKSKVANFTVYGTAHIGNGNRVQVDSSSVHAANLAPTDVDLMKNPAMLVASTLANLRTLISSAFQFSYSDTSENFVLNPDGSVQFNLSMQNLLSILPEAFDALDPQQQRKQALAVYHACQKIMADGEVIEVTVGNKKIKVKPVIYFDTSPLNGARVLTREMSSSNVLVRTLLNAITSKDEFKPLHSEFIHFSALNSLLQDLIPFIVSDQWTLKNNQVNYHIKQIQELLSAILNNNGELNELLQQIDQNHHELVELYKRLNCSNPSEIDSALLAEIERLEAAYRNAEKKLADIYAKRFADKKEDFESTLIWLHNSIAIRKNSASDEFTTLLSFFNFAQDVFGLMDLNFTQEKQIISGLETVAPKGLKQEYNGYLAVITSRLNQQIRGCVEQQNCFDTKDRTGARKVWTKAHEVFQSKRGHVARHNSEADRKELEQIHARQLQVNVAARTSKETSGSMGFQSKESDNVSVSTAYRVHAKEGKLPHSGIHREREKAYKSSGSLWKFISGLIAAILFLPAATTASNPNINTINLAQVASSGAPTRDASITRDLVDVKESGAARTSSDCSQGNSSSKGASNNKDEIAVGRDLGDDEKNQKYSTKVANDTSKAQRKIYTELRSKAQATPIVEDSVQHSAARETSGPSISSLLEHSYSTNVGQLNSDSDNESYISYSI